MLWGELRKFLIEFSISLQPVKERPMAMSSIKKNVFRRFSGRVDHVTFLIQCCFCFCERRGRGRNGCFTQVEKKSSQ